jgi:hypothetical protein
MLMKIKSRRMRWAVRVAHNGENKCAYSLFWGGRGHEGKKIQVRSWYRCGDNIKMCLQEIVWIDLDWVYMAQNSNKWLTVADSVMNLRGP